MQIKPTMRYLLQYLLNTHPLELLKLKRLIVPSVGKQVEELELSYSAHGNVKWYKQWGKWFGSFLKNSNFTYQTIKLSHSQLSVQENEKPMYIQRLVHECSYQLYLLNQNCKQAKCLSAGEWINQLVIHTTKTTQ